MSRLNKLVSKRLVSKQLCIKTTVIREGSIYGYMGVEYLAFDRITCGECHSLWHGNKPFTSSPQKYHFCYVSILYNATNMCITSLLPLTPPSPKKQLVTFCLVQSSQNEGTNLKDTPCCLDGILKNSLLFTFCLKYFGFFAY